MTEDYVSFEIAKLLKEKGFDGECYSYWHETENKLINSLSMHAIRNVSNPCFFGPAAPTFQMTMKWLLVMHHLLITTFSSSQESWMYRITKPHQRLEDGVYGEDYETREDAIEAAIKYCLENLVP